MKFDLKKIPIYFLVSFFLALVLFLVIAGLSFWLFVFLVFWVVFYLVFIAQILKFSFIKYEWIWIFFGILLLLSIGLIFLTKDSAKKAGNSTEQPLTAAECAPIVEKYDGKSLNVSADGLTGRVSIRITDKNTCKAEIAHHYLLTADLPRGETYGYMGYTSEKDDSEDRNYWNGNGYVSPVYKNGDTLPADLFQVGSQETYSDGNDTNATSRFFVSYTEEPYLSESRYQKLKSENKLFIIDGREFIIVTDEGGGSTTATSDDEKGAREGLIVKIFDLKFSD
jgi:hypothetical protein